MESLQALVKRYGTFKEEADKFKKQIDADNKEIKNIMSAKGLETCEAGGYEATYKVIVSEDFDETKLIKRLENYNVEGLIKMKPYVDMQILENAIYSGEIKPTDLADCKTREETPRLTIKKAK